MVHNNESNKRLLAGSMPASPDDSSDSQPISENNNHHHYQDRSMFESSDDDDQEEEEEEEEHGEGGFTHMNPYTSNGSNNRRSNNPFLDNANDDDNDGTSSITESTGEEDEESLNRNADLNDGSNLSDHKMDYKGYYASKIPNSTAPPKTINRDMSFSSLAGAAHQTGGRYPVGTSRVGSQMLHQHNSIRSGMNTLANNNNNTNNNNNVQDSARSELNDGWGSSMSLSETSQNPVSDQDFSPFGGYPASSFPLLMDEKEEDDYLHNPDPEEEARLDRQRFYLDFKHMDKKSFGGFAGVVCLLVGTMCIFILLPVLTFTNVIDHVSADNVYTILSLYEYPQLSSIRTSLVDPDTPSNALSTVAKDGSYWKLVFSDEFNAVGRTFHSGDDQFWESPNIHYQATEDLEWYSPDAASTDNGTLNLRMDAYMNHDLFYRSGMVQSWNKLCFTQGKIEISAKLPNYGEVTGLWPGLWTMGNLGRPGYMGSTEGLWPYSYEACDAGITPNQSSPDGISYLPGQKLSACTCNGEDHPNQGVGRGAPEIDIIEGEVSTDLYNGVGLASQSLQVAPFDIWYMPDYDFVEIYNFSVTTMNTYCGGPFQQAVSAVTTLNTAWYEFGANAGYYQTYAIEYMNDDENGYIRWFVGEQPTWTMYSTALHPNGNIDWRYISKEPMSIIMNLGISNSWAYINWQSIFFPVTMSIDYVRIYQPNDSVSITCDPEDFPTYDYIQNHLAVYENPNITAWTDAGFDWPANMLTGDCSSDKCKKNSDGSITC